MFDASFGEPPISTYLEACYGGRLDPRRLDGGRYVLVRCDLCELIYQRHVLTMTGLTELYSTISSSTYEATQAKRGLADRRRYSHDVEQAIKYFECPPVDLSLLDFGAGWGLWLDMAAAYGCGVSAVELSTVRRARFTHEVFSLETLPPDRFHYINSDQVFEHLVDPAGALRHLVTALRPGGLLRISVPYGDGVPQLMGAPDWSAPKGTASSLNAVAPLEHVNCFNHKALVTLATNVGRLERFRYPVRQSLDRFERVRFIIAGLTQAIREPTGTTLLFRKPG